MVRPRFQIGIHVKDKALLEDIKNYLRVGQIYKSGPELIQLKVQSLKELESVINHFQKYPLKTKKLADFNLIIMVNDIMRRKEHLTQEGLIKIIAIKASMNRGLSEKLKLDFPDVYIVERPKVDTPKTIDPQ